MPHIKLQNGMRKNHDFAQETRFSKLNLTLSRCSCVATRANKWTTGTVLLIILGITIIVGWIKCLTPHQHGF